MVQTLVVNHSLDVAKIFVWSKKGGWNAMIIFLFLEICIDIEIHFFTVYMYIYTCTYVDVQGTLATRFLFPNLWCVYNIFIFCRFCVSNPNQV